MEYGQFGTYFEEVLGGVYDNLGNIGYQQNRMSVYNSLISLFFQKLK